MNQTLPLFDLPPRTFTNVRFGGPDVTAKDAIRLTASMQRIFDVIKDGRWRTLQDVAAIGRCSVPAASARLRDLRKANFGSHTVNRRRKNDDGVWVYQLIANQ